MIVLIAIVSSQDRGTRISSTDLSNRIKRRYHGSIINHPDQSRGVLVRIKGRRYLIKIHPGMTKKHLPLLSISVPLIGPSEEPDELHKYLGPSSFRMSITPERIAKRWKDLTHVEDIKLGNKDFDERYFLHSNNEKTLKATLTSQCQDIICRIHKQSRLSKFEIRVVGNELQLDQEIRMDKPAVVFVIVRLFADLHHHLSQANLVAEAVEVDAIVLSGDTTCLICGEPVVEHRVKCGACLTEYHRDCWEYLGGCGRYACGERKWISPKSDSDDNVIRIQE